QHVSVRRRLHIRCSPQVPTMTGALPRPLSSVTSAWRATARARRLQRWRRRSARGASSASVPELPEVEVVRSGLAPAVIGATVTSVSVLDERALTRHAAGPADFAGRLEGRTVVGASRRGKFLWLPLLDGAEAMTAHLGMSGQMLL